MVNSINAGSVENAAGNEAEAFYVEGTQLLKNGESHAAINCFKNAVGIERAPLYLSSLAFCLAKEQREFPKAISLCKEAIRFDPRNPAHFLRLGRIHLLAGQRKDAIRIFRMGLRTGKNPELVRELERLGSRKEPVLPFLARGNPLNKFFGIMFKKTGLR